ncbi:MAG: hypothetical protein AAGC60_30265 [Acidobacteriota bacterium]
MPKLGLPWLLLAAALGALVVSSLFYDRSGWPDLLDGEATILMQSESLARDGDLAYSRLDFDRLLLERLGEPPDLELVSGSDGRDITYDRPFVHAAYLAPFVRLAPATGWAPAHALALALAAWLAAAGLRARLGAAAPLWVLVLVFGSVAWLYVFQAVDEGFFFALTLAAAGLILGAGDASVDRRWLGAGLLLSVPMAADPLHAVVVLVAALAAPRLAAAGRLLAAVAAGVLVQMLVRWWAGGGLLGAGLLGASGFRFTPETGFPLVDFQALEWTRSLTRFEALHYDGAPDLSWGLEPLLWLWNLVYLVLGESIGLLPYCAPLLLLVFARDRRGGRAWLAGFALWVVALFVLHPFDLFGGATAIGNRRILPLLGLLPVAFAAPLDRRRLPAAPELLAPAAVAVVAALFLLPSWSRPWAYPLVEVDDRVGAVAERGGIAGAPPADAARRTGTTPRFRHVGALARRLLPYETSQRPLPGGPLESTAGVRLRFLDEQAWFEERWERVRMEGDARVDLLVASHRPVDVLRLSFGDDAPAVLEARGASLGETVLESGGGVAFRLLPRLAPRHATWWSPRRQSHYRLTLSFPAAPAETLTFRLIPEFADSEGAESAADAREGGEP